MAIKLVKYKDGIRPTWWGRYCVNGKYFDIDLRVPVRGKLPMDGAGRVSLKGKGDEMFERSRVAAQREFEKVVAAKQESPEEMRAKVYHARTGINAEGVPLNKLAELWKTQKRGYTPTEEWTAAVTGWFDDFLHFAEVYAREHGTRCATINDVTPEIAGAWFDELKRTFAWETVTKKMSLMRGAFRRYATNGRANPFEGIVVRNREAEKARVNHKPLTAEQTERLFAYSQGDRFVYPLIVTAACTGMRIGDVCNLKWSDVDLDGGFIDVVTAKAGVRATMPIFSRLRDVLREYEPMPGDGEPSPFVFPRAAAQYERNADHIYRMAKPYFAQAVFEDVAPEINTHTVALEDVIDNAGFTQRKRDRLLDVYAMFKAGKTYKEIGAKYNAVRSQVSMDLQTIERLTGETLRPKSVARAVPATRAELVERTRGESAVGRNRKASLYGWHSLRATFVVLAHEAGVPLADIARVVGHTTTDMTMQYFNPEKRHAAERLKVQLRGSVLDNGPAPTDVIEAPTVPAIKAAPHKPAATVPNAPARIWAIAAAAMAPADLDRVNATLAAAGIDANAEPERALAVVNVLLPKGELDRIMAVCTVAGVVPNA